MTRVYTRHKEMKFTTCESVPKNYVYKNFTHEL